MRLFLCVCDIEWGGENGGDVGEKEVGLVIVDAVQRSVVWSRKARIVLD